MSSGYNIRRFQNIKLLKFAKMALENVLIIWNLYISLQNISLVRNQLIYYCENPELEKRKRSVKQQ